MRIAIIGSGGIARKVYFPILLGWPGIEICGVYSRTQATIHQIKEEWAINCGTTKIEDILAKKPKAAIVISSTNSHYEIIKNLLKNSIDVFSEKPLTTESKLSIELGKLANQNKLILAVGFNRRYASLYQQAREIFGARRIQFALIQKHRRNGGEPTLEQFLLDDIIHQIDLVRFFCGEVSPISTIYSTDHRTVIGVTCQMWIAGGGQCLLAASRMAGAWQEGVDLHGDGFSLHLDAFDRLTAKYPDHEVTYGTDRPGSYISHLGERGFIGELEHFFECVKNRQTPRTNAFEAAKTQELMEKLIEMKKEIN